MINISSMITAHCVLRVHRTALCPLAATIRKVHGTQKEGNRYKYYTVFVAEDKSRYWFERKLLEQWLVEPKPKGQHRAIPGMWARKSGSACWAREQGAEYSIAMRPCYHRRAAPQASGAPQSPAANGVGHIGEASKRKGRALEEAERRGQDQGKAGAGRAT